jgi:hypothetical protein
MTMWVDSDSDYGDGVLFCIILERNESIERVDAMTIMMIVPVLVDWYHHFFWGRVRTPYIKFFRILVRTGIVRRKTWAEPVATCLHDLFGALRVPSCCFVIISQMEPGQFCYCTGRILGNNAGVVHSSIYIHGTIIPVRT